MTKKKAIFGVAVALAAGAFALALMPNARGSSQAAVLSGAPELVSQLPPGAPTIIYIDLAAMRQSGFYRHRPSHAPLTVPDRDYANFVQATGFDFEKDLDRVAIAAWPQAASRLHKSTVVLAEGRFNQRKIRDYALRNGKLTHQFNHEVLLFPASKSRGWNSLVFLQDDRIAIVQGPSIAPALTRAAREPADNVMREQLARVQGAAVFAISRVSPIPKALAPGGTQPAPLTDLIRSVRWVTLAARPEGDDLRVSLEGQCGTEADARQLQSAIQLLRTVVQAGLESPKTHRQMDPATLQVLETLLKSANVTATATRVRILMDLAPNILKGNRSGS